MKTIILKLLLIFIGFIFINFVIYRTSGFYEQENIYFEKIEKVIENQPKIIFLGDSHVETIKQAELSDNVGDLAFGADGINEMYIKLLTMIEYNKKLEIVFVSTEPQIFNGSKSPNSTFMNTFLLRINDSLNVYNKNKIDFISEFVPLFNDNFINYFLNDLYLKFKPEIKKEKIHWIDLNPDERRLIASNTGKSDHLNIMSQPQDLIVFRNIVEVCKNNNIKVIGINFPVSEDYINECKNEDYLKVKTFINNLDFYKVLDYSLTIHEPVYFKDEDHLNPLGIEKLIKILEEETNLKIKK